MKNTKINAEDLKIGDIIHIPASSFSNAKDIEVTVEPVLEPLLVRLWIKNLTRQSKVSSPAQFGRKVDLVITRKS